MFDYSKLRGRIKEKIGTECEFAGMIGRSQGFITHVFQGKAYFSPKDMVAICKVLDISHNEIPAYFFDQKVVNR